jgi:hypothetical protein
MPAVNESLDRERVDIDGPANHSVRTTRTLQSILYVQQRVL